ncbi:MAG: succinylglutamate desuccinylase/aspartoacylase family protein [Oligoflexia bacterium]|nr:succinylglutamate desuccinylase/aspartoacylase family protein [Oligoflexia bacterium]
MSIIFRVLPISNVALANVIEAVIKRDDLLEKFEFVTYPLVNLYGLKQGIRRTLDCKDLNRSFQDGEWTAISRILSKSIQEKRQFSFGLDLHGSGKQGIFIINGLAFSALAKIDHSDLQKSNNDTYPGKCGGHTMLSPGEAISRNQGTLKNFFAKCGIPYCYTFEYPKVQSLEKQVTLMTDLVLAYFNASDRHFFH